MLKAAKEAALQRVKNGFENEFSIHKFTSSLGFECDNRRYGSKNDKDNLQSIIDLAEANGDSAIMWVDAAGVEHTLTLADAKTLKNEMSADGLAQYHKKWQLESDIEAAVTVDSLKSFRW